MVSSRAHAKILNVDVSKAMALDGVHAWVDHESISEKQNKFATTDVVDELLFAVDEVFCVGMIIGAVVAENQAIAQTAARLVTIEYEDLPAIITMEEAIKAESYHHWANNKIEFGNVDQVLSTWDQDLVVEGSMRTGAQEHFYLETQVKKRILTGYLLKFIFNSGCHCNSWRGG